MKLFQALLVVTTVILLYIPTFQVEQVSSRPTSTDSLYQGTSSQPLTPELLSTDSISPDSLRKSFERAVWSNDTKRLKELINYGVDVNHINKADGYAAIHWAVERRLTQTVRVLLKNGADIDLMTSNAIGNDRTPLHIAAELGHSDIVRILLDEGANIHKKTIYGESALHGVRLFVKNKEVVRQLIAAGADVNAVTEFGTTPLHAASLLGSTQIVDLLINSGARINEANKRGLTPLHHAAHNGHLEVINKLLAAHVEIDAQTRTGDTAMHLAAKKGHSEIIRVLLNEGANPLTLNKFSKSPLSEAQDRAYDQVVEILSELSSAEVEEG